MWVVQSSKQGQWICCLARSSSRRGTNMKPTERRSQPDFLTSSLPVPTSLNFYMP